MRPYVGKVGFILIVKFDYLCSKSSNSVSFGSNSSWGHAFAALNAGQLGFESQMLDLWEHLNLDGIAILTGFPMSTMARFETRIVVDQHPQACILPYNG